MYTEMLNIINKYTFENFNSIKFSGYQKLIAIHHRVIISCHDLSDGDKDQIHSWMTVVKTPSWKLQFR